MWLYCLMILLGVCGIAAGIILARKTKKALWHILTAAAAIITAAGLLLTAATVLLVFRADDPPTNGETDTSDTENYIIGGDWRTWRGYTADYILSDELTVCFSRLSDSGGYGVYDSLDGSRIGTLIYSGNEAEDLSIGDIDGDGYNDVCVHLNGGEILWFTYVPEGVWSADNVGGCFSVEAYTIKENADE